jgi:hypothetical protein
MRLKDLGKLKKISNFIGSGNRDLPACSLLPQTSTLPLMKYKNKYSIYFDRLCGLVVRVLGYRSGGPGSILGTTKKK